MNIIQKLTLAHLKKNKGRTIVTILGICVSVAMITAVFVSIASIMNYIGDVSLYSDGHWQARVSGISEETADKLASQADVQRVGRRAMLAPEVSGFKIDYGVSSRTSTGSVFAADMTALQQLVTCDMEGSLPKNENEILVEKEFIESNNLDWQIGDTVTVPVGARYYTEDGETLFLEGNYYAGESFEANDIREFQITGILNGNLPTRNYQIIRPATAAELSESTAYVELKDININSVADIRQIMTDCGIDSNQYELNDEYLSANYSFDSNSSLASSTLPMVAVILAVIIFASVALIYNAFGMSLSERTRYLGMLASVGATKAQKSASVYFEGFLLGLVGIPVGIGAGLLGIYITLRAVGTRIQESGMINGGENVPMNVVIPFWVIIGIIIVSAFTIFISAMIPAKKASSITPIDALRQTNEIKIKSKKLKSSKLVRAVFGYEGELANKNLKRNGRKSRVITASIALSIVLFLSVNSFCDMFVKANDLSNDMPYQVYVNVGSEADYDMLQRETSDSSAVIDAYSITTSILFYSSGTPQDNMYTNQGVADAANLTSSYSRLLDDNVAYINFVDDEDFNSLCEDNGIDSSIYYTNAGNFNELKALIMNNVSHDNSTGDVFTDNILGKAFYYDAYDENGNILPDSENENLKAVATDFIKYDPDNYLCNLNSATTISLYVPLSMYISYYEDYSREDVVLALGYETEDHEALVDEIEKIVDQNSMTGVMIMDVVQSMETMNTLIFVLQVFIYGFVALITLISIANIINTVSTGIDLRRKEFAMFKSVGITPQGFNKMICLESLFYGLKAIVFAIPISILLSLGMYLLMQSSNIPFTINIPLYLIVILAVFLIVGVSMLYAVSKLKKDSIVETLKEDIC